MATIILNNQKSSYGRPWVWYTVYADVTSKTPTKATISGKVSCYVNDYEGAEIGGGWVLTGNLYVNGGWHSFTLHASDVYWGRAQTYTPTFSFDISITPSTSSLGTIYFSVSSSYYGTGSTDSSLTQTTCSSISISSLKSSYADTTLSAASTTTKQTSLSLSSVPTASGYTHKYKWYKGNTLVATTTTASYTMTGLLPNSSYTMKCEIYGSETISNVTTDTLITTLTKSVTTSGETANLSLSAGSTFLTVSISGMTYSPNYTRTIDIYYKKSIDFGYTKYTTISSQLSTASTQITGLVSGLSYIVYAEVKNGASTLKTLSRSATTITDSSLVPMPTISNITQRIGVLQVIVSWLTNKAVSGTTYELMYSYDNSAWSQTTFPIMQSPSTVTVTLPQGYKQHLMYFKIKATNTSLAVASNYSNVYSLNVIDTFEWTYANASGQKEASTSPFLAASEWNALRSYAMQKGLSIGLALNISTVSANDPITAAIYNEMKNEISKIHDVGLPDRVEGDDITAACINALRTAVNG